MKSRLLGAVSACAITFTSLSANAALVSRLGGQAYYDDVLDVTWLADANLVASNTFGLAYNTDLGMHPSDNYPGSYTNTILTDGRMSWGASLHWTDAMNADGGTGYLGFDDWRLPTWVDTGAIACDTTNNGTDCGYNVQTGNAATMVYSEMASIWYDTLGNLAYRDTAGSPNQPGWGLTNTGPFSNVQLNNYWLGVEYPTDPIRAIYFSAVDGFQHNNDKSFTRSVWVLRSGDSFSIVPVPAAVWLFGSGLLGLIGIAKRKKV